MKPWLIVAIVLGQLVGLAFAYYAPRFWIKRDVGDFNKDPAADTFHDVFHRQRLTWRIAFDVVAALVCSAPLLWSGAPLSFWVGAVGLASIGGAYFFFKFNPGLSLARGLAYVQQYYVSFDPRAAWWPDRWLAGRAKKAIPWGPTTLNWEEADALDKKRRAYAARELELLCRWVLALGIVTYGVCAVLSWRLML
ncbi:hypothetical protein [Hymenobacter properus]|uniref:Uncharacterized protein n=1 Tax=Hymenobacter properus TaxID=2791026 RepID=A0A931BIL6_9BACT|nr:hypothetical protein [Hymenobacter properus]MBF9140868.1 hypothetical protein [Hymenobacter properus]MBR7719677.1 hypothetical protein [Microvirga sp. SRT04]